MRELIKTSIRSALPDAEIYVFNPDDDGKHFEAIVISEVFKAMSPVEQHRTVMNAVKSELETVVHALALKTFTPEVWAVRKSAYDLQERDR